MWRRLMPFLLAWISMATPTLCQSGDWSSGFGIDSDITSNATQEAGDEPGRTRDNPGWVVPSTPPDPQRRPGPDGCAVRFSAAPAHTPRARREELAHLRALQSGNLAVVENLQQFVGAELGDQRYEDVIQENVAGIQEDQRRCREALQEAEEYLEEQLEGEATASLAAMQKIRTESAAFEDMLRAAADIAGRLEVSSQALQASFAKQLKDMNKVNR